MNPYLLLAVRAKPCCICSTDVRWGHKHLICGKYGPLSLSLCLCLFRLKDHLKRLKRHYSAMRGKCKHYTLFAYAFALVLGVAVALVKKMGGRTD
jgi:hypothetical protein